MQLSIQAVLTACKGRLLNPEAPQEYISSVCTDTRKLMQCGESPLFVPISGENFDGHNFIVQAAEMGAVCALSEHEAFPGSDRIQIPVIWVKSTRRALMDMAAYYRRLHDVQVIAVTGSAGKTTTKEMIASMLSQRYKVKKTLGNFNNDIGLPLSVFQLEPDDEVLVLEMGMSHANEISALSQVGAPHIAVITHIGDAHIENFANREGILCAKLEIVDGLRPGGTVVVNGDDPLLTGPIAAEMLRPFTVYCPGKSQIISAIPNGLTETRCHFRIADMDIHFTMPLAGGHMVMNALLAAVVGIEMGLGPEEIANGFAALELPGGRLQIIQASGMTIINDAYNANPASMKEAINVLVRHDAQEMPARRVCILGDMNELGHVAEARHRGLGIYAADAGIDLLISIGTMARWMHEGYLSATDRVFSALYFPDVDAFMQQWRSLLFPGDIILIKASRGMAFEKIVEGIQCQE